MKKYALSFVALNLILSSCRTTPTAPITSQPTEPIVKSEINKPDYYKKYLIEPSSKATSDIPDKRSFPLSKTISPCEDFYLYTCEGALKNFKIRDDRSHHGFAFSDSAERILKFKKNFMANIEKEKKLSPRGENIRDVYLACMNSEANKLEELKYIDDIINQTQTISCNKQFSEQMTAKTFSGLATLLNFNTLANQQNPDYDDVLYYSNLQKLPERSYYDNKELLQAYKELISEFFKTIQMTNPEARAQKIIDVEKKASLAYPLPSEIRKRFSVPSVISKEELKTKYPMIHWEPLFAKLPTTTLLRDPIPESLQVLNQLFKEEDLSTLKDIYIYFTLSDLIDESYPEYFNKKFDFNRKFMGGPLKRAPKDERCTKYVMNEFTKELDEVIMPKMFPNFPEQKFKNMVEKVRSSILEGIKNNTWLTEAARKSAALKMEKAKLYLVKPQNEKEWDFQYIGNYSSTKPVTNHLLHDELRIKKELEELKSPRNKEAWHMGPLTVNAYYSPSDNKFVIPMGILQYPFYDGSQPEESNIGAIGAVIAHELGHGIDDNGAKYNEKGELKAWMTDTDVQQFKLRGSQLVERFNNIGHNGELTLGENIADLVGLTFAYNTAFKNDKKPSTKKLQNFYLGWGRSWCTASRPDFMQKLLKTDPHSAGFARVNEQVKLQKGFSEAYNCKPSDPMYFEEKNKITIW